MFTSGSLMSKTEDNTHTMRELGKRKQGNSECFHFVVTYGGGVISI